MHGLNVTLSWQVLLPGSECPIVEAMYNKRRYYNVEKFSCMHTKHLIELLLGLTKHIKTMSCYLLTTKLVKYYLSPQRSTAGITPEPQTLCYNTTL